MSSSSLSSSSQTKRLIDELQNVNPSTSLVHPQFFLIHSGLGEMDVSYHLTNPSSRLHKADLLESFCNLTEENKGHPYNVEIHVNTNIP
jgi:hypothetical protein